MKTSSVTNASTRRLIENAFWSLIGNAVPVLAAILLIPFLLTALGSERFGLLALIWAGVGYFSLFDLGISRGLIQRIAFRLARNEGESIPVLVRAGLFALCALGVIAAAVLAILTPWLVSTVVVVSSGLQEEARQSLRILSLSLPFVLVSAGFSGVLEGYQRFQTLAYIRIPLGISNFVVPAMLATATTSLVVITIALVMSRIAMLAVLAIICRSQLCGAGKSGSGKGELTSLLCFGGWLTVSNAVGPVLTYFDRFFISALTGLAAVAHYVTPHELVSKMTILPQAIMSALFPSLSYALVSRGKSVAVLVSGASWIMLLAMLPLTLTVVLFAKELLAFWLTADFASESAVVAQLLAVGVLVNTFARIPITALQGDGRADITAKVHLSELLPYLVALSWLTKRYGIEGAAVAWLLRSLVDCVLLWICSGIRFSELRKIGVWQTLLALAAAPVCWALANIEHPFWRGGILSLAVVGSLLMLGIKIRWLSRVKDEP